MCSYEHNRMPDWIFSNIKRYTSYSNVVILIYRDKLEFMFGSTNRSDNTVVARARFITIVSID